MSTTTTTTTVLTAVAAFPHGPSHADADCSPTAITASPSASPTTASSSSRPPEPELTRNHAPGIPDRRKSALRASLGGRPARVARRPGGPARRVSCIGDMAAELRIKDSSDDDDTTHSESERPDGGLHGDQDVQVQSSDDEDASDKPDDLNDHDTFEDATSTPRPASPGSDADAGAATPPAEVAGSGTDLAATGAGLDIFGGAGHGSSTTDDGPSPLDMISPSLSPRERSPSPTNQRSSSPVKIVHGLSGDVALPTQPPPSTAERRHNLESRGSLDQAASPPPSSNSGFARRASSGFNALLGRMGSIRRPARSPPGSGNDHTGVERRSTFASLPSVDAAGEAGLEGGKRSLQDQFSHLRRKEEFGNLEANGYTLDEQDEDDEAQQTAANGAASPPLSPAKSDGRRKSSTTDLPPGTASGISAGPPSEPYSVNWDLWQQLVYEGPSAVTRTSGDELNAAITAGIPSAIRGVVWQVLAESKSEDLENAYRILKARGTEPENKLRRSRTGSVMSTPKTTAETVSDTSSVHSNPSPGAPSGATSPRTSVDGNFPELQSKLLAEKLKRETASLQKLEKAIKRDMGSRTSYSKYTQSAGLQDGLFGVCKAYALFDEGVGYAQGINFIAMPLLFNMGEEEAFTLLVRLMSKYDLRSMFTPEMRGLHLRLYQFERVLEDFEPAVYCHLKRRNVEPQLYATQWFLTLFVYRFPLQLVLRIYDLVFSEGLTAILKFGIVLIRHNRDALLAIKDMSQLTTFLKEKLFDVYIDKSPSASSLLDSGFFGSVTGGADKELYRADDMVKDACAIHISDATLKAYSFEWEEAERTRREREAELEGLRTSNASLTSRIKALEARAQQHDTEHVTMAQDLVKIKVENDSLHDANEALKVKVVELEKIADKQPEEVENRLKAEMDRIMQRNIEVQNENRHLKEEMDEMEQELVNSKMAHAQAQADHDALKARLTSVQAMLSEKQ